MDKKQLTQDLVIWLKALLDKKYGHEYQHIEVLAPERDLKRLNHPLIRSIRDSHAWEFTPDIIGILKGRDTRVVLLSRSTSAISLKEIGEMYCYTQLTSPLLSIVISPKAASSEVNGILLDKAMQEQILSTPGEHPIMVLGWDAAHNNVDLNSVIPLEKKSFFA